MGIQRGPARIPKCPIDIALTVPEAEALLSLFGTKPQPQTPLRKAWDKLAGAVQRFKGEQHALDACTPALGRYDESPSQGAASTPFHAPVSCGSPEGVDEGRDEAR